MSASERVAAMRRRRSPLVTLGLPPARLVLGTPSPFCLTAQPSRDLAPSYLKTVSPARGFVTLREIKFGNFRLLRSGQTLDAGALEESKINELVEKLPVLTTTMRVQISGEYSGLVPDGFLEGTPFPWHVVLFGYAE